MAADCYFVYMLICTNQCYYTGYTADIMRRYRSHLDGTSRCKFTRSFKPLALAQCWQVKGEKSLAMRIEHFIKKLSRLKKEFLILNPDNLLEFFTVEPISNELFVLLNQIKVSR